MSHHKLFNGLYALQVGLFFAIIAGFVPREASLLLGALIAGYFLWAPLEDGVVFFVQSIPLFLALPLTQTFDNFNTWRLLSSVLILKWAFQGMAQGHITWREYLRVNHYTLFNKLLIVLGVCAIASVVGAGDTTAAMMRVLYFANLSFIGIVIHHLAVHQPAFIERVVRSIAIPTVIVLLVGLFQVVSTYFIDIYQFMRIWGEGVQCRQFGEQWCYIAVWLGNTWFAYFGDQLSLRVFSLFPDSHSFPIFVLLGIPALFAISIHKLTAHPDLYGTLRAMMRTRVSLHIVWVALALLMVILSGTRGMWAASIGVVIITCGVLAFMRVQRIDRIRRALFSYIALYLVAFYLLFGLAYPIFASPQFLLSKGNLDLLRGRIRSIIDFGETSNSQRIDIWKWSISSIQHRPVLGVGIGNFPAVLRQNIKLADAGSSAHNIYLHVAAEMGIPALIAFMWAGWLIFWRSIQRFFHEKNSILRIYWAAAILYVPWVFIYSLTDVALFDERAFLLFIATIALIMTPSHD